MDKQVVGLFSVDTNGRYCLHQTANTSHKEAERIRKLLNRSVTCGPFTVLLAIAAPVPTDATAPTLCVLEGDCTEPNRAECPRRCIDFCNKAETEKAVAGLPSARAAMCQNGCAAQALGDTAFTKRCAVGDGVPMSSPIGVFRNRWQTVIAPHMIEVIGACSSLLGAALLAWNGPNAHLGWLAFLVSNAAWLAWSWIMGAPWLFAQTVGFTGTSVLGIWRWIALPARRRRSTGDV